MIFIMVVRELVCTSSANSNISTSLFFLLQILNFFLFFVFLFFFYFRYLGCASLFAPRLQILIFPPPLTRKQANMFFVYFPNFVRNFSKYQSLMNEMILFLLFKSTDKTALIWLNIARIANAVHCHSWLSGKGKKIYPHFFLLENASVIAETNFTFGPMFKTIFFLYKNGLIFPRILVPQATFKAVLMAVDKT